MLRVRECSVRYGSIVAVRNVSFDVARGSCVALVGPNGAGKTSLFSALAGVVASGGTVEVGGTDLTGLPAERRAAAGLAFVPDGRRLFGRLSVEQNVLVGTMPLRGRAAIVRSLAEIFERFPLLAARRTQQAGTLSGGEGQVLMIARALVASPKVVLVDEPFQGLSAEATALVLSTLREVAEQGGAVAIATPEPVDGVASITMNHGALAEVVA